MTTAATLLDWDSFGPRYDALLAEPLTPGSASGWLRRWSDLDKELSDIGTAIYKAKDIDTGDKAAQAAYLHLIREVQPRAELAAQALKTKLLALEGFVPEPDHEQVVRHMRGEADLFREANVPLLSSEAELVNEFNSATGARMVSLGGEELTVPQARRRLQDPDRGTREAAWQAIRARELQDAPTLDALLPRLLGLRRELARNAGLPDYRAFVWRSQSRDYSPEVALAFQSTVEAEVVPLVARLREARRAALGVERLRPWDLRVDPDSRPPLHPFSTPAELEEGAERAFSSLDPELGAQFRTMREHGDLDLWSRPGKVTGIWYCAYSPAARRAYVFGNAVGTDEDVGVLLHEVGHAFHAVAAGGADRLIGATHTPTEFAEVASQAMELLALPHLGRETGGFYSDEELARWRRSQLVRLLEFIVFVTRSDAFEHWLYADAPEGVTTADLDTRWAGTVARFDPGVDWRGLEAERAKGWQSHPVIAFPFYTLSYAFAWMAALGLWRDSLADPAGALARYKAALALGGTRPLPELYDPDGASNSIVRETAGGLMRFVEEQLGGGPA